MTLSSYVITLYVLRTFDVRQRAMIVIILLTLAPRQLVSTYVGVIASECTYSRALSVTKQPATTSHVVACQPYVRRVPRIWGAVSRVAAGPSMVQY
jgi:hypothetical protein